MVLGTVRGEIHDLGKNLVGIKLDRLTPRWSTLVLISLRRSLPRRSVTTTSTFCGRRAS